MLSIAAEENQLLSSIYIFLLTFTAEKLLATFAKNG
jgi:hypothetical protein